MKLAHIILEGRDFEEYRVLADQLSKEFGNSDVTFSLGEYVGGREDNDPLRGKGFGKMSFRGSDEIAPEEWNKAIQFLKGKDYEITEESNYYEVDPGERTIYPTIKFQFNVDETN